MPVYLVGALVPGVTAVGKGPRQSLSLLRKFPQHKTLMGAINQQAQKAIGKSEGKMGVGWGRAKAGAGSPQCWAARESESASSPLGCCEVLKRLLCHKTNRKYQTRHFLANRGERKKF